MDTRNVIAAISLSAAVIILYSLFFQPDPKIIKQNLSEQKKDLFDRGYDFKVLKVDQTFPKFIYENQDKFKDFIYTDAN